MQGSLVHDGVHRVAVGLGLVGDQMLQSSGIGACPGPYAKDWARNAQVVELILTAVALPDAVRDPPATRWHENRRSHDVRLPTSSRPAPSILTTAERALPQDPPDLMPGDRGPGSIGRSNALFTRWFDMHLSSSSAAGVRFLTSVREGRGLNRSAREVGIGKETGYRWLREAYVAYRRGGKSIAETEAVMGLASAKSIAWEAEVAAGPGRHHLRVAVDAEARFWAVYDAGTGADAAASAAGVGRSTGYRWLDRRFCELRAAGMTLRRAQRLLRLTDQVTARAEGQRASAKLRERQAAVAAHEEALRSSRQYADRTAGVLSKKQQQRAELVDTYWQLMRSGETNASACRVLGMSRRSGTTIRRAHHY